MSVNISSASEHARWQEQDRCSARVCRMQQTCQLRCPTTTQMLQSRVHGKGGIRRPGVAISFHSGVVADTGTMRTRAHTHTQTHKHTHRHTQRERETDTYTPTERERDRHPPTHRQVQGLCASAPRTADLPAASPSNYASPSHMYAGLAMHPAARRQGFILLWCPH